MKNRTWILVLSLILMNTPILSQSAHADQDDQVDGMFFYGEKDWDELLGQPPLPGSIEEMDDVSTLLNFQNTRSKADCADAASTEKVSLKTFFGGDNGVLSKKEIKKLKFFWLKYFIKSGLVSQKVKKHFGRPRPFVSHEEITPCIKLASGLSYPSGHTTVSRLVAHALGRKFPERKELFLQRADQIGRHRMLGGVHYPSDVKAGKKLADYLAAKYFDDEEFMNDLLADQ